jgi:YVTN family beta-propeller protein
MAIAPEEEPMMNREIHESKLGIRGSVTVWLLLLLPAAGWGQNVTATVPVGTNPVAIGVNPMTNKVYVANCPDLQSRTKGINGTITVIDGDTNSTATVQAGLCPTAVAVNQVTNKIYVANFGHISLYCGSCFDFGGITVIDGVNNATTTVNAYAKFPVAVAVNPVTNKIYVANHWNGVSGNVTVIDGVTNSTASVSVGRWPYDLAVNTTSNKIYVTSFNPIELETSTAVSLIDGATNTSTPLTDPNAEDPIAVAVNPITNKIYVANNGDLGKNGTNIGSITVIDDTTNSTTNITDANALSPHAVAVNPVSNRIYVANGNGSVTVIDGATNSVSTITDPNALPCDLSRTGNLAVDPTRNLVYVTNCDSNNVTVIDAATNSVVTVTDSSAVRPIALAVNSVTDKIYVANAGSNNVTVIDGGVGTQMFTLSVTEAGSGHVTSNPAGIDCGSSCSAEFISGTPVSLTASPSSGSTFTGWSGACSGTSNCTVSMNANESVTANFTALQSFTLSVTEVGSGRVTSNPAGIDCGGGTCTANFVAGTPVTLSASPASGSTFSGWSEACSGASTCSIAMTSNESATATFNASPPPDFSLTPASANLTLKPGGQISDVITIAPQNGSFSSAVQLSCAVLGSMPMATCALSSSSLTLGANSVTSVLTITAPAQSAELIPSNGGYLAGAPYAVFLPLPGLTLIGLGLVSGKSKNWKRSLLIVFVVMQVGCGGTSTTPPPPPPLNYTVTVTATAGAIHHSTQVSVAVQ